jgi:heme-degrading monooxygenase HmoA
MIVRMVRMTFKEELIPDFMKVFDESKQLIRSFPGCLYLELLKNADQPHVIYTYSHWEQAADLENYRNSDLFNTTWARTKILFADKPSAWSMEQLMKLG